MKDTQFKEFTEIVARAIEILVKESNNSILYTKGNDHSNPFGIYMGSIPKKYNNTFLKNKVYECNCCKNFIKKFTYLFVKDYAGKTISLWDTVIMLIQESDLLDNTNITIWSTVAYNLNKNSYANKSESIMFRGNTNYFLNTFHTDSGKIEKGFYHFFIKEELPITISKDIENKFRYTIKKFREINFDHPEINNLFNLVVDKNIYRHEDLDTNISTIKNLATNDNIFYTAQKNLIDHTNLLLNSTTHELLKNVIEYGLEVGVNKYEKMVAGENYQRPKALVTAKEIGDAATAIKERNMTDSVADRRFIKLSDIKNNSIYFDKKSNPIKKKKTNKKTKKSLIAGIKTSNDGNTKNKNTKPKYKEVKLDNFLQDIVPGADWIGIATENRLIPNKVDITIPLNNTKPQITKWSSGISWTYDGNVPESSITKRVRSAGGNVDAAIRCSLSWDDVDDLDIHASICNVTEHDVINPIDEIYYNNMKNLNASIELDVDMNAIDITPNPVENIAITDVNKLFNNYSRNEEDIYIVLWVNNFKIRTSKVKDNKYTVELKVDDKIYNIKSTLNILLTEHTDIIKMNNKTFTSKLGPIICCLKIDKHGKVEIKHNNNTHTVSELTTYSNKFVKVQAIFNTPKEESNKHTFFVLKDKVPPHNIQCLHTTMIKDELYNYRKALHYIFQNNILEGSKKQKLIYGFSYSKDNHFLARVDKNGKTYKYKVNINR